MVHALLTEQAIGGFLHNRRSLYNFSCKSTVRLHSDGKKLKR